MDGEVFGISIVVGAFGGLVFLYINKWFECREAQRDAQFWRDSYKQAMKTKGGE